MRIITSIIFGLTFSLAALAEDKSVTVAAGDAPGLVLTVPGESKVYASKELTDIRTSNMTVVVRHLGDVKNPEDAIPKAAELIKAEFLKFKATSTNKLTIAGAPAVELFGTGEEADDGDAGTADVIFFSVGRNTFIAYVHGEHNPAEKQRIPMHEVLKTVRAP